MPTSSRTECLGRLLGSRKSKCGLVATDSESSRLFNEFLFKMGIDSAYIVLSLSVDRWIGLEGVMATVALTKKISS